MIRDALAWTAALLLSAAAAFTGATWLLLAHSHIPF
jgi:hypothetical protein